MSVTTMALSPAEILGVEVTRLIMSGDLGAALVAAKRGSVEHPEAQLAHGMTFTKLCTVIASKIPGASAETPAVPEESVHSAPAVSPVSAAPVSAAPVSVAPAVVPVSVAPVSAPSAALVIERTAGDGTIIVPPKGAPKLNDVLKPLGWNWAKRGFYYLGDRDTAPNMSVIAATQAALSQAGLLCSVTVRGDEPARPVSAPPARPVSAAPAARRQPTRRERARKESPVEIRYVQPVSAAPVSPVAPVFAAPAPVAPAVDPALAMLMQQMEQVQAALAALSGQQAPAAPAPVAAPVAAVAPVESALSLESALASLIDEKSAALAAEVEALSWHFRVAKGASARKTAQELRERLADRVGGWWAHHDLGQIVFGVVADRVNREVLHVTVKAANGEKLSPRKITQQVLGTALTVRGVAGTSTKEIGDLSDR